MNSQEIIFKIDCSEVEFASNLSRTHTPFIIVNTPSGKIFSHTKYGTFLVKEKGLYLELIQTYFPRPNLDDWVNLGRISRFFSSLNFEYKLFLENETSQELLFSHIKQKFCSK